MNETTYYITGYAQAVGGAPCLFGTTTTEVQVDPSDDETYWLSHWLGRWSWYSGLVRVEVTKDRPADWPADLAAANREGAKRAGLVFRSPALSTVQEIDEQIEALRNHRRAIIEEEKAVSP